MFDVIKDFLLDYIGVELAPIIYNLLVNLQMVNDDDQDDDDDEKWIIS